MKPKKNDLLLILLLLAVAAVMWLFFRPGEAGAYAVVTQSGREIMRLSLSEDRSVTITTDDGGFNTLVVKDGEIYVSEANCGDHTCIRRFGKISREREQITCLPHNLVIEVIGGEDSGIDASTH